MALAAAVGIASLAGIYYYYKKAERPTLYFKERSPIEDILKRCPHLERRYFPPSWCTNGHLSTLAATFLRFGPNIHYHRTALHFEDGGKVTLDWTENVDVMSEEARKCDSTPTVIIFHGLAGGSHASYVKYFIQAILQHNWRAVVMNARGTHDTELLTPRQYCGAYTGDARETIRHVRTLFPHAPLLAIGYSLGANVLVKYLGEEGDRCPLVCAVSVANPFDFISTSRHLMTRKIYNRVLTNGLVTNFKRHIELYKKRGDIEINKVLNCSTLHEFDHYVTRVVFGYPTAEDYYRDASSKAYIPRVRIPLLCINAVDDPLVPEHNLPKYECRESGYAVLCTTPCGGHIGHLDAFFPLGGSKPDWADRVATEFMIAALSKATTTLQNRS